MSSDRDTQLEQLTARALRELPLRRAPSELEARVLAVIEQRARRSQWRGQLTARALAVRSALIAACCGSAVVVLLGWSRLGALVAAHVNSSSLGDWLLGGLLAAGVLYAMLFALIAIGYSTLYAAPERSGARAS